MLRFHWLALGAVLSASSTASAGIVNLGTANAYNVFVLGDNTQSGTDAEGKVAVGGNANFGSGYTIASKLDTKSTNLVVGGNYANNYNSVNGNVVIGGNATINGPTINGNLAVNGNVTLTGYGTVNGALTYGGTLSNSTTTIAGAVGKGTTSLPVNFDAEKTNLTQLSADLAKTVGNTYGSGVTFQYGGLTLTGKASDINVFTIKGSDLASANNLTINATAGSTVVINIDGTNDQMKNFGFNLNGVDKQHVLFNFTQATSLYLTGVGIQGSILAPQAAINFSNGNIDGTIVGATLSGGGESHNFVFTGDLSPVVAPSFTPTVGAVPEPATLLSTATGLGLVGLAFRRRRIR